MFKDVEIPPAALTSQCTFSNSTRDELRGAIARSLWNNALEESDPPPKEIVVKDKPRPLQWVMRASFVVFTGAATWLLWHILESLFGGG